MALIGHDSVAMSQHYSHVGRDALEKATNAFPDIRREWLQHRRP